MRTISVVTMLNKTRTQQYIETVKNLSPIAYFPMTEKVGTVIDNAEGTAARDGAYTGVTLASTLGPFEGGAAPLWDGSNDYGNIYTASLASAFNGAEGSVSIWAKVQGAGVWTDGVQRGFVRLQADTNNRVIIQREGTANNRVGFYYIAGGTTKSIIDDTAKSNGWNHYVITWSSSNDRNIVYLNGEQVSTTQTGLGTWAGSLASTTTVIGATSTTPTAVMHGYLAHAAVFDRELTAANVTTLYNGGPQL